MLKIPKFVPMFLSVAIAMLLLFGSIPAAHASELVPSSGEVTEIDFSEVTQKLKLEKGKNYLISCPVSGDGWQISEIRYCDSKNTWKLFDNTAKNNLLIEKLPQSEPGKVQFLVKCKSTSLFGLKVVLENALTGEKKGYTFSLTVTTPAQEHDTQFDFVQSLPPSGGEETPPSGGEETPPSGGEETPPSGGEETPPSGGEETPPSGGEETPPSGGEETPPSGGEETPPLITIDTSGWSFDSITTVYDGTEYTVEVTGLPDYVTPVYTNNKRTNAGTTTSHVSFLVPEGYAVPDDMETTITIEKAPIYVITEENLVVENGKLQFVIPDDALPEGVKYTYLVNGVAQDDSYSISNVGSYLISAGFELPDDFSEEMKGNYITDPSTAIFNVMEHEDITLSQYGLNFRLTLNQEEGANPNEVKVSVGIKFDSSSGRNNYIQCSPKYDSSELTYQGHEVSAGLSGGNINSHGVLFVANYDDLLNDGILTTLTFTLDDGENAKNIPFTITDVKGVWMGPDPGAFDSSTAYSVSIILNPDTDVNQYTVMLPPPSGNSQVTSLSEESQDITSEDVISDTVQSEESGVLTEENAVESGDPDASDEEKVIVDEDTSVSEEVSVLTEEEVTAVEDASDASIEDSTTEVVISSDSQMSLENSAD